ncbi:MAG: hypothetical protein HY815_16375, partial [Candidatus Riflebacteria bacterium]|nr:hypothetical protein [Candidatus Riflebacteria bacterium]
MKPSAMLTVLVLTGLAVSRTIAAPLDSQATVELGDPGLARAVQPTNVVWLTRSLTAGPHTIETRSLSTGGDTVLHLIRDGVQVAMNDDRTRGGDLHGYRSSRIDVSVPTAGTYRILVRGHSNATGGTCDVSVDGAVVSTAARFGGFIVTTAWAPGDRVQTAHYGSSLYNATDTVLYAFSSSGQFLQRNDDLGCNLCSRLGLTSGETAGQIVIAKYGQSLPASEDRVRLIINPISRGDADGDNLANALESWLGTDPSNPDTDGDGLADDWEVFGLVTPYGDEDLPAYDASPVRKDLFVELDVMALSTGGSLAPQA